MFRKILTTVYPNGIVVPEKRELVWDDAVTDSMGDTRAEYAGADGVLSVEETADTLVVVRDSGIVQVFNWI